jgi:hypothetical protein
VLALWKIDGAYRKTLSFPGLLFQSLVGNPYRIVVVRDQ